LVIATVVFSLGVTARASAKGVYPGFIQDELHARCFPSCLLCHTCPEGGLGCMKPSSVSGSMLPDLGGNRGQGEFFANLMAVNGGHLYPSTEGMLEEYLQNLQNKPCSPQTVLPCDSDGDQVEDVAELRADSDPDVPDEPGDACILPSYGCGASIAPTHGVAQGARHTAGSLALLGVGAALVRRRARRTKPTR
jgi:hypothetical protein